MAGPGNILIRVGADTAEAVRNLGSLNGPLSDVQTRGERMGSAIRGAALPATAALAAVGAAAKVAADDASSLNESVNAVNVVFAQASGKIQAFSKVAAEQAGLSARAFNELATPIGASLRNVGFSADDAATSTINLAKRAADMASVFNVDVTEAMAAIQSGLRGEADPLEKFGVGLSAAAVQAKAMELGLAKTTGALDNHDLAQARLALIMDQTNKLSGDFTRTSGQLANAQRINAAESENQRAALGQGLLPVMVTLQGMLRSLLGLLAEHQTATKALVVVVAGLAAGILIANGAMKAYAAAQVLVKAATATWTAAQWLLNAALTANPIGIVVVAIAALAAGIAIAYTKSETFREAVGKAWALMKLSPLGLIISQFDTLAGAVSSVVGWISRIHFPSPPSWFGKIGGLFGGTSAPSGAAPAARAIAARSSSSARSSSPRGSGSAGLGGSSEGITINVFGATDPEGTARAIKRTLAAHNRRQGALGLLAEAGA